VSLIPDIERAAGGGALTLVAAPVSWRRARSSWKVWLFLIGVVVLVIGGAFVYLAWRQNVPGVQAEIRPRRAPSAPTPLTLALRAAGRIVWTEIRLVQGQGRAVLANHAFPDRAGERRLDLVVDGKNSASRGRGHARGPAGDGFWRPCGRTIARCCRRR